MCANLNISRGLPRWIVLIVLCGLCTHLFAAESAVNISGFWQLNGDLSDNPKKAIKGVGKIEKPKKSSTTGKTKRDDPIGSDTYRRYWEHVADDDQWRKVAETAHGGSIRSILFAKRIASAATEKGFKLWYDDGFVRDIKPNPNGRVFTASGEEIVTSDLGRTLSYIKADKIISETRAKPRGKIAETYQLTPDKNRLLVNIEIDRPDWDRIVVVKQTFDRIPASEN